MSSGGSARLRPTRECKPRQNKEEKVEAAKKRAISKCGVIFIEGKHWSFLDTDGAECETADGILMGLMLNGLSEIEIRSTIRVAAGVDYVPPTKRRGPRAFNAATLDFLFLHMETWRDRLEDGFPCPHRRMKSYFSNIGNILVFVSAEPRMIFLHQTKLDFERFQGNSRRKGSSASGIGRPQ